MKSEHLDTAEVERRLISAFQAKDEALTVGDRDYVGGGGRSSSKLFRPLVAAAIVVIVVAIYAVVALTRSPHASRPVDAGVPPETIGRLWNLADQLAAFHGTTIKVAQAVLTTDARAETFLFDSSSSDSTSRPTWAVQAETTSGFSCCAAPGATSAPSHEMHFILMAVRASSFEQVAGGLSATGKEMTRLGKVITLTDTGVPATPRPTPAQAVVQTSIRNDTGSVVAVVGCPQCAGAQGLALNPNHTLRWTEQRTGARYSVVVDGRRSLCRRPPEPEAGAAIGISYRVTASGTCMS